MNNALQTQLLLEDLLADLHFARKNDQLGRLALLAYCEVKGWARQANKPDVANTALRMFLDKPCVSKEEFLHGIDQLVATLELHAQAYQRLPPVGCAGYDSVCDAIQTASIQRTIVHY